MHSLILDVFDELYHECIIAWKLYQITGYKGGHWWLGKRANYSIANIIIHLLNI